MTKVLNRRKNYHVIMRVESLRDHSNSSAISMNQTKHACLIVRQRIKKLMCMLKRAFVYNERTCNGNPTRGGSRLDATLPGTTDVMVYTRSVLQLKLTPHLSLTLSRASVTSNLPPAAEESLVRAVVVVDGGGGTAKSGPLTLT